MSPAAEFERELAHLGRHLGRGREQSLANLFFWSDIAMAAVTAVPAFSTAIQTACTIHRKLRSLCHSGSKQSVKRQPKKTNVCDFFRRERYDFLGVCPEKL